MANVVYPLFNIIYDAINFIGRKTSGMYEWMNDLKVRVEISVDVAAIVTSVMITRLHADAGLKR